MLTIGDKFPAFDLQAVVSLDQQKAFSRINCPSSDALAQIGVGFIGEFCSPLC